MAKGLNVLSNAWHGCQRCDLSKERSGLRIVFGFGEPTAKYLLVYESPSEADAAAGLPMVGQEGDLLIDLLTRANIPPAEVYCTPLVGCRPTVVLAATEYEVGRIADREPSAEEFKACAPRLKEIIYRLDPLIIFTLGPGPFSQLVRGPDRRNTGYEKALGDLFVTRVPGRWLTEVRYDVIPLMSMPQIMQKPSTAAHGPRATTAEHLTKGRAYATFLEKTGRRDAQAAAGLSEAQ